jgi:hypothetical protein
MGRDEPLEILHPTKPHETTLAIQELRRGSYPPGAVCKWRPGWGVHHAQRGGRWFDRLLPLAPRRFRRNEGEFGYESSGKRPVITAIELESQAT